MACTDNVVTVQQDGLYRQCDTVQHDELYNRMGCTDNVMTVQQGGLYRQCDDSTTGWVVQTM